MVLVTIKVRTYWSCRMPQVGKDKMAEYTTCGEWYYQLQQRCDNVRTKEVFALENSLPFVRTTCR